MTSLEARPTDQTRASLIKASSQPVVIARRSTNKGFCHLLVADHISSSSCAKPASICLRITLTPPASFPPVWLKLMFGEATANDTRTKPPSTLPLFAPYHHACCGVLSTAACVALQPDQMLDAPPTGAQATDVLPWSGWGRYWPVDQRLAGCVRRALIWWYRHTCGTGSPRNTLPLVAGKSAVIRTNLSCQQNGVDSTDSRHRKQRVLYFEPRDATLRWRNYDVSCLQVSEQSWLQVRRLASCFGVSFYWEIYTHALCRRDTGDSIFRKFVFFVF